MNSAIEALSEDLRQAVTLREIEGLSYEEIAEVMNCPIGTVRSRIFRAREAIAARLRPLAGHPRWRTMVTPRCRNAAHFEQDGEHENKPDDRVTTPCGPDADGQALATAWRQAVAAARPGERTPMTDARAAWHAYHLIGDVMRSERPGQRAARDEAFLAALRERLAAEPVVLAPRRPLRGAGRPGPAAAMGWLARAAVAAGFVVVAGVLARMARDARTVPGGDGVAVRSRHAVVIGSAGRSTPCRRPNRRAPSVDGDGDPRPAARPLPGRARHTRSARHAARPFSPWRSQPAK